MLHRTRNILLLAILLVAFGRAEASADARAATLKNLQEAHASEVNSRVRYEAFADQAQREGFAEAATLFRAAALAEGVHARNLARVIRELGAEPHIHAVEPVVRDTRANLRNAAEDELYEQETMYPEYLATARDADLQEVIRFLTFVAQVEEGHGNLFRSMIDSTNDGLHEETEYRVCNGCGFTEEGDEAIVCPFCGGPAEGFEEVE